MSIDHSAQHLPLIRNSAGELVEEPSRSQPQIGRLFLGGSASGKSSWLTLIASTMSDADCCVTLLDPHSDLLDDL